MFRKIVAGAALAVAIVGGTAGAASAQTWHIAGHPIVAPFRSAPVNPATLPPITYYLNGTPATNPASSSLILTWNGEGRAVQVIWLGNHEVIYVPAGPGTGFTPIGDTVCHLEPWLCA